jgi:16S rRNA (adenine1518-N6/adenine1519-N6)-dimethyltransferase
MRYSRQLGQVFLKDKKYIKKILSYLEKEKEEYFLEIGPGRGEITQYLAKKVKFLYAIEVDFRLFNLLKEKFSSFSNIEVIYKDILKFPLSELNKKLVIFANTPFQISTSLIKYLIKNRSFIKKCFLTFQKEFTQKLIAKESKDYTFLSCYIQYYAKVEKLFDIPRRAFSPSPKVDASFIHLEFYLSLPYKAENESFLFRLIRRAFCKRRKKIINALPVLKNKEDLLSSLSINPQARAEQISLQKYVSLANELYKKIKLV